MRTTILVFAAMVVMLAAQGSEAEPVRDPGAGFLDFKRPKVQKDYYVVKREGNKCSIIAGKWGDAPDGAVGAPYASKSNASSAMKDIADCKGGKADDWLDTKKHGKK
jgi:hypothetical protein